MFKYLRQAGLLDQEGTLLEPQSVDSKVAKHVASRDKRLGLTQTSKKAAPAVFKKSRDLDQLIANEMPDAALQFIPGLDEGGLDPRRRCADFLSSTRISIERTFIAHSGSRSHASTTGCSTADRPSRNRSAVRGPALKHGR